MDRWLARASPRRTGGGGVAAASSSSCSPLSPPAAGAAAPSADLAALITSGDLRRAAQLHPARPHMLSAVHGAFRALREARVGDERLVDITHRFRGNLGSVVGTLLEFCLQSELDAHGFRPQQHKHESDFVHRTDPLLNLEVKSTSMHTKADVYGNRIAPRGRHKSGSFLLAVQYEMASLQPRRVRFGWVTPDDWIPQRGTGQQSRLSESALARLLVL